MCMRCPYDNRPVGGGVVGGGVVVGAEIEANTSLPFIMFTLCIVQSCRLINDFEIVAVVYKSIICTNIYERGVWDISTRNPI